MERSTLTSERSSARTTTVDNTIVWIRSATPGIPSRHEYEHEVIVTYAASVGDGCRSRGTPCYVGAKEENGSLSFRWIEAVIAELRALLIRNS